MKKGKQHFHTIPLFLWVEEVSFFWSLKHFVNFMFFTWTLTHSLHWGLQPCVMWMQYETRTQKKECDRMSGGNRCSFLMSRDCIHFVDFYYRLSINPWKFKKSIQICCKIENRFDHSLPVWESYRKRILGIQKIDSRDNRFSNSLSVRNSTERSSCCGSTWIGNSNPISQKSTELKKGNRFNVSTRG